MFLAAHLPLRHCYFRIFPFLRGLPCKLNPSRRHREALVTVHSLKQAGGNCCNSVQIKLCTITWACLWPLRDCPGIVTPGTLYGHAASGGKRKRLVTAGALSIGQFLFGLL